MKMGQESFSDAVALAVVGLLFETLMLTLNSIYSRQLKLKSQATAPIFQGNDTDREFRSR